MAITAKKEVKVRPVRMDVRLANDVEKLARKTFRSQNDIAVIAMRKYLYENRRFFIEDMIDDCIFREIEPTITVRKESAAVSYGVIGITADKTKNPDVYHIKTVVRNKEGEYIFSDVHDINITGKNDVWKCYKEFVYGIAIKFINVEDDCYKDYFYDRFQYD